MYYKGDKHAAKAVKDNARFIGTGLANLISLYSPEIIILGGGMALAREDYIASIRDIALDNSLEHCSKDLVITTAALGNTASLQGSAMYALTRLDGRDI